MEKRSNTEPPLFWLKLLRWFCREDLLEDVEGDLLEMFYLEAENSPKKAKRLVASEVFKLFRPRMIKSLKFQYTNMMYLNFFKVAYRNALTYKSYTLINLLGLVLGVTTSILIYLWIEDEVNKDKFHSNIAEIYTIRRNMQQSGGTIVTNGNIPHPLTDLVKNTYPEVKAICEVSWPIESLLDKEEKYTFEIGRYVSPNFFKFFSYELIIGDADKILENPSSIVLSEKLAKKYLVESNDNYEDLLGEIIKVEDQFDVTIAGILKDPGNKSSLEFDWLIPNTTFIKENDWLESWGNGAFNVHVLLQDERSLPAVATRIESEIEDHTESVTGETLWLQKYSDTYLYDQFENGMAAGGRIVYVNIMKIVAIFILLVACINYMNLTTARASRRAKEIGVRKVMGAIRLSISRQFYVESMIYAVLAVGISLTIVYLLLPFYNTLVDKQLTIDLLRQNHVLYLFLLILGIGFISGSYPAQRLSRVSILAAMNNLAKRERGGVTVRKGLVVFQVGISFILLFGSLVIGQQIKYMLAKDTGIERENIIAIWLEGELEGNFETYRNELMNISGVKAVTAASGNPVRYGRSTSSAKWEGQEPDTPYEINVIGVYDDYFENLGLEIVKGRSFIKQSSADSMVYMINEAAAAVMNFEHPIGKELSIWGMEGHIVGVVENYHSSSLRRDIAPLILLYSPNRVETALITLEGNSSEAISKIEELNKAMNPKYVFEFEFLEDVYKKMYDTEILMGKLSTIFVGISIAIAVLGLLGLAAYSTEKRTKEIGIRKVHGASIVSLLVLLSKEYVFLILIAFVMAMPLGYWYMQDWLTSFAYHTTLGVQVFVFTGFILLGICLVTVLTKAYQTTQRNPTKTLRSE